MSTPNKMMEEAAGTGVLQKLWLNKSWWLLPLIVLLLLIAVAYLLGHLSAADPETYPTTWLIPDSFVQMC